MVLECVWTCRPFCPLRERTRPCSCAICLLRLLMSYRFKADKTNEQKKKTLKCHPKIHLLGLKSEPDLWYIDSSILVSVYTKFFFFLYTYTFISGWRQKKIIQPLTCFIMYVSSSISTDLSSNRDFLLATEMNSISIHIHSLWCHTWKLSRKLKIKSYILLAFPVWQMCYSGLFQFSYKKTATENTIQ